LWTLVGASFHYLCSLGLLCGAHTFNGARAWTPPTCRSVVAFHNSHPPFVFEAAHVQYKPQVVYVAVAQLIAQKTTVREDLGSTPSNGTFCGWLLWITTSPFFLYLQFHCKKYLCNLRIWIKIWIWFEWTWANSINREHTF